MLRIQFARAVFPDETPDEMSLPPTSPPADSSDIHGLAWDATLYYVLGTMSLAVAAFGNLILVRFVFCDVDCCGGMVAISGS